MFNLTLISGFIGLTAAILTLVGTLLSLRRENKSTVIIDPPGIREENLKAPPTSFDYRRIKDDILQGLPVTCPKCGRNAIAKRPRRFSFLILLLLILLYVIPGFVYWVLCLKLRRIRYRCEKCKAVFFELEPGAST